MAQEGRGGPGTAAPAERPPPTPRAPPAQQPAPGAPHPPPQYPAAPPQPYGPPQYQQPFPVQPPRPEPWGAEDPVRWGARRARAQAIWGSAAVAALLMAFGAGLYLVFTYFLFEGTPAPGERGPVGGFLLLVLSPLVLAVVGAVAAWRLLRTCGAIKGREGAPEGLGMARATLGLSVLLWAMLFPLFFVFLAIKTGEKGDFPLGLVGYLPVYLGLCVAVYISGAALAAWSRLTRVETGIVLAIGWGALAVYLLFPAIINPARVSAGDWELVAFWFRFGAFMAALLPCLAVLGLLYAHSRWLATLDLLGTVPRTGAPGASAGPGAPPFVPGRPCPSCGGTLVTHPRTGETFCPACGFGLPQEQEVPWPPP